MSDKKNFWDFVRRVSFMRECQKNQHEATDKFKKQTALKRSKALEKEIDDWCEQIFKDNPEQAPKTKASQPTQLFSWLAM